jgi:hypothetical protein
MYDRNHYDQAFGAGEAGTIEAWKSLRSCQGGHSSIFAGEELKTGAITVKRIAEEHSPDFPPERS